MAKAYVLYNPIAGNGQFGEYESKLKELVADEVVLCDMTTENAYEEKLLSMNAEDYVIICGGDGTLNRFVNKIAKLNLKNDVRYFPCGSGNDFAREFGKQKGDAPFSIKEYIEKLPTVTVGDNTSYFINGVGYGIDGYCCEEGDKQRAASAKPVDYTAIAIKGLLFHYKPTNAKITVDGKEYEFKKVWLAPTMNGKYYGGGMLPAPAQDRNNADGKLSVMVFHGSGALKTLMIFPSIFKGEHVKHEKYVTVIEGYDISVEYDSPRALQIDGETVVGVSSYTAKSHTLSSVQPEKEEAEQTL